MPQTAQRWGIVGGGFLGMTLAHRLAQHGQDVTLFEAAPALGGLASAWSLGDVVWDRHYHVTLLSDAYLRALLTELGLEKEMFGYVPGGYARTLERYAERLASEGVRIELRRAATKVEPNAVDGVAITFADGTRRAFDQVVVTLAAPLASRLCAGLSR